MTPRERLQREAAVVATRYLIKGLGNCGQSDEERRRAERAYLEFAGFEDTESPAARAWLSDVTAKTPRGRVETETAHLQRMVLREHQRRVPPESEDPTLGSARPKLVVLAQPATRKQAAQPFEFEPEARAALEEWGCSPELIQNLGLLVSGYRAWVGPFDGLASRPGLRSPESRAALLRLATKCYEAADCLCDDSVATVQLVAGRALEGRSADLSPAELAAALRVVARVAGDLASETGPADGDATKETEVATKFGLEVARLCRRYHGPDPASTETGSFRSLLDFLAGAAGLRLPGGRRFYAELRSALTSAGAE